MLGLEISTRQIKKVTGNASNNLIITPTANKRLHSLQAELTYAAGTNTLAALMTALSEIRVKVGTVVKSRFTGTQLRDYMLLHGTTYDFNGLPNTGAQVTIPFAPEWFLDSVADALAWNPQRLGGAITVEIDSTATLTATKVFERTSDDLNAPSAGVLTMEVIRPVAGGVDFYVKEGIDIRGQVVLLSVYPDTTNSNEITPLSVLLGQNDVFAHERLSSAQNDEELDRFSLTPAAAGRTANIYDVAPVKADMLKRAYDLPGWGEIKLRVEAASAMAGVVPILIVRLE